MRMSFVKIALLASVLFGSFLLAPFIHQRYQLGDSFRGIYQPMANDTYFYMSRIQDVLDGHPFISNSYLWEHKNGLPQQLFLAEYILAQPLKILHLTVQEGVILYTGLLGSIGFFLLSVTFYRSGSVKFLSIPFAAVFMVGIFAQKFLRPVSPQFNFIFFITLFLFLWQCVQSNPCIRWFIASGVNLGFLFYIYPYYWTLYVLLLFFLLIYVFLKERKLFFRFAIIPCLAAMIAIPYVIMTFRSVQLPEYSETLTRLGMIATRFPSGIEIMFWSGIPFLVMIILLWKERLEPVLATWFLLFGLVANMIAVNQHIVTGKNLEFSSHYLMGAVFFSLVSITYMTRKTQHSIIVCLVAVVLIIFGMQKFFRESIFVTVDPQLQDRAQLVEHLNNDTAVDSVVFTDSDLSDFIPAYTHNNIYFSRNANLFIISDKEVIDRFLISHYFDEIDESFIRDHVRELFGVRYQDQYSHIVQENKVRRFFGLSTKPEVLLPDDAVQRVLQRWDEIRRESFEQAIKRYRFDLIIPSS